jgi:peptide chain release factor 2
MAAPDFWNDPKKATEINRAASGLRARVSKYDATAAECDELEVLWEIIGEEGGAEENSADFREFVKRLEQFVEHVDALEATALLSGEFDAAPALVTIHAGAGGTESHDWVDMLARMYSMFSRKMGWTTSVLDFTPGEVAGTKSLTMLVEGELAYGYLRGERGVHRLVRISPFDANKRRHTSFAAVDVIPEIEEDAPIDISEKDLKIDTYRASSAGGQHVNKTDSAVRITHLPTGIVVTCQNERSQHKNRLQAMRVLRSRLAEMMRREKKERVEELRGETKEIAWGSQIRNYVLQPYQLVKDTRTDYETGNVQAVLDGEILPIIWALLRSEGKNGKGG